jgi:hypothetical protein
MDQDDWTIVNEEGAPVLPVGEDQIIEEVIHGSFQTLPLLTLERRKPETLYRGCLPSAEASALFACVPVRVPVGSLRLAAVSSVDILVRARVFQPKVEFARIVRRTCTSHETCHLCHVF